jgi:hypothetical protein
MTRRWKFWPVGVVYFFVNIAGAIYGAVRQEEMHMMLHLFLILLGVAVYAGWWLGKRGKPQSVPVAQLPAERLEYLQQSVDAIALEVERVGEAQRFADKLRAERGDVSPLKKD